MSVVVKLRAKCAKLYTGPVDSLSLLTLSSKFLKFDFNTQPKPVVFRLDYQLDNYSFDLL